jgi:hypothetical protein
MTYIYIILLISIVLNITFIISIFNLLKQTEELEDTIIETTLEVKVKVSNALENLRNIDSRGSFESDDEVGATFTELKTIVENLNEIL